MELFGREPTSSSLLLVTVTTINIDAHLIQRLSQSWIMDTIPIFAVPMMNYWQHLKTYLESLVYTYNLRNYNSLHPYKVWEYTISKFMFPFLDRETHDWHSWAEVSSRIYIFMTRAICNDFERNTEHSLISATDPVHIIING